MNYKKISLIVSIAAIIVPVAYNIYADQNKSPAFSLSQNSDSGSNVAGDVGGHVVNGNLIINPTPESLTEKSDVIFTCGKDANGSYATYVRNSGDKRLFVIWETEDFLEYSPSVRCETATKNFQKAYDSEQFKFMTHGIQNAQPIICATSAVGNGCEALLITLRHRDDEEKALQEMSKVFLDRSKPFQHAAGDVHEYEGKLYIEVDFQEILND